MANTKIERLLFRIGIELKSTFGEFLLHSDSDLPRIGKNTPKTILSPSKQQSVEDTEKHGFNISARAYVYQEVTSENIQIPNANNRIALQKSIKASKRSERRN